MKLTPTNSISLISLAILLGIGSLPLAAEPQAVPPAFEKPPECASGNPVEDPFDPMLTAPKQVQVQVEYIELSTDALNKLLFLAKPKTADSTALRKKLQKMVRKDEARILEIQLVVCRSGQRATTDSLHEFIYPTEYEPLHPPATDSEKFPNGASFPYSPATPTAFETRNVGTKLEVEPTLSEDDDIIDLRLDPELLWHTSNTTWQEAKDELGNISKAQLPNFYVVRFDTSVTCVSGQYVMLAVLSPKDSKGKMDMNRKVMVFVKCDVLSVQ
jgi:hypothetical protein